MYLMTLRPVTAETRCFRTGPLTAKRTRHRYPKPQTRKLPTPKVPKPETLKPESPKTLTLPTMPGSNAMPSIVQTVRFSLWVSYC